MVRNHEVLLISERPSDLEQLRASLAASRFCLRHAAHADRPVELLATEGCAAILLDHSPSAEYLLRLARRNSSSIPLILMVDAADPEFETRVRELGATDVLLRSDLQDSLLLRRLNLCAQLEHVRREVQRLTTRDSLSGALSRNGFRAHLKRAVMRAERHRRNVGLMLVNISRFTLINEQYGEETGDRLIKLTAQRLSSRRRMTDSVARLGADEFAVILEDIGNEENLQRITDDVLRTLRQPILLDEQQLVIEVALGSAMFAPDGADADGLVEAARAALTQAKTDQGSRALHYRDKLSFDENGSSTLAAELRQAVRGGELGLHFQPRVEINTGEMVGLEALLRWHHPSRGTLLPETFISSCQSMGLMSHVGYQVVKQACDAVKWMDRRLVSAADIAINISFEQLLDDRFVEVVSDIVGRSGIDPCRLELELTETAMLRDPAAVRERMERLAKLGVQFSLDDFGAGFSQLSHITELPISALKIDRQFVRDAPANPQRRAVCRTIIEMARQLGLIVIAQGVENHEQLRFLADEGCHQVQGFFFSEGINLAQVPLFVQELRQNRIALSLP
jgi:diguanylate cyclase (GGDEF)-like protein